MSSSGGLASPFISRSALLSFLSRTTPARCFSPARSSPGFFRIVPGIVQADIEGFDSRPDVPAPVKKGRAVKKAEQGWIIVDAELAFPDEKVPDRVGVEVLIELRCLSWPDDTGRHGP